MPTPTRVAGSQDGPQLTVNWFLKQPNRVRNLVLDMSDAQFIADALLRQGPSASSGAVVYQDPVPLFADGDAEIVGEYGEIPGAETPGGLAQTKATTKRGLAVKISQEMRDRNDVGRLRDQMRQVRNTMVRTWDNVFFNTLLQNSNVQTAPAGNSGNGGWYANNGGNGTQIRSDLSNAMYEIAAAYYGNDEDQKFGYQPDTLVINNQTAAQFLDSDEVNAVFSGSPMASESLRYTGKMPRQFFSLDVIRSWQVPNDTAIVLQRGMVGFISDERPLNGTPLYEDRPRETWRSDFVRTSVVGIDNPKSAFLITGINA